MEIRLWSLKDARKETIFENCVADVNIPVGEVFTSPVLEGTNGVLHVSRVYLDGLQYKDLELKFKDGKIVDYRCGNFKDEEEGRRYIFDNVLKNHDTLPLGEFAIGTNTTAYQAAKKYGIDFSLKRDKSVDPPRYFVFFKARDVDVMTAAFREFTGKTLNKTKKPSVRKKLQQAIAARSQDKQREREKSKEKQKEPTL